MSHAIAAPGAWNVLLSQGMGNYGSSPSDPLNPYAGYGTPGMSPPPRRSAWPWILGIGGGVMLLLCAGCGLAMYFGVTGVMGFMGGMVKEQIQNDPVIVEHIGEVENVDINYTATGEEAEKNPQPGRNVLVFDVKGSKGSGQLVGTQVQAAAPGHVLEDMKLRKDGREYPLSE